MRFLLTLLLLAIASGCSPGRDEVENAVKSELPRPKYVTFEGFQYFNNDTVCGQYMGLDVMGDMHGFRPFIYAPSWVDVNPGKVDIYIFCSNEQAKRLQERYSFSIANEDVSNYIKIKGDFETLDRAISVYIETHKTLPASLEELVNSNTARENSVSVDELQAATLDPWGYAYHYKGNGWGGVSLDYDLCTHGANGESGGGNIDKNICKTDLKYFSILINL
ncbi:MAG: type II secretion system protein GspG [Halioglobus sp.]